MTQNVFTALREVAERTSTSGDEAILAGAALSILEQVITDLHRIAAALEEANRMALDIETAAAMRRQLQPFGFMQQQDP